MPLSHSLRFCICRLNTWLCREYWEKRNSIIYVFNIWSRTDHVKAISEKYTEASELNAEFELNFNNAIGLLQSEHVHLKHLVAALCAPPDEEQLLLRQIEPLFVSLFSETELGLVTALNSYKTIEKSFRFASLRKWDECLSILHRHVAASKDQLERIERALGQLHSVLDNAQLDPSEV